MQEVSEKMTKWRESISLNHAKSKRIFTITDEIKKMKAIGKRVIKYSRTVQASSQKDEAVKQTRSMLKGVNSVAKEARKLHLLDATPETIQQLDRYDEIIKEARIELEDFTETMI